MQINNLVKPIVRWLLQLKQLGRRIMSRIGAALLTWFFAIIESRNKRSIPRLEREIAVHPDNIRAREDLAHCLRNEGRKDEAIEQLKQACALRPELLEALNGLAEFLCNAERYQESYEAAMRSVRGHEAKKGPLGMADSETYAVAWAFAGDALVMMGRPKEARECWEKAVAALPKVSLLRATFEDRLRAPK